MDVDLIGIRRPMSTGLDVIIWGAHESECSCPTGLK